MKRFLPHVVFVALIGCVAFAGTIKTWNNGEPITPAEFNYALAHIHTAAEASITNSKVSATAAIAHSKLATPALVPKAVVMVADGCAVPGTCTMSMNSGFTSVAQGATAGQYTFTLTTARTDTTYMPMVTCLDSATRCSCSVVAISSTTVFTVYCMDLATPSALTSGVHVVVFDNDN